MKEGVADVRVCLGLLMTRKSKISCSQTSQPIVSYIQREVDHYGISEAAHMGFVRRYLRLDLFSSTDRAVFWHERP